MNYQQTVEWLYGKLPNFQNVGKSALNNKLDNILKFSEYLSKPEKTYKTIHIAGTNGKGSSSHMIASILQQAGYKTGLYTSPHLKDFRERIRIDGVEVSEDFVTTFVDHHKAFLSDNSLSFFEMTVGMAFDYFKACKVDVAVIETGLGGRLDSTNIITPEICLITNIAYDHTDILGHTLAEIAFEKAGIIKHGVPIVISEFMPDSFLVFEKTSKDRNAPLYLAQDEDLKAFECDLKGVYQKKNIKGVLTVIKHLKGFEITDEHIEKGLKNVVKNTGLKGRWQQMQTNPNVVFDTAHNKAGFEEILTQILLESGRKHYVLGFVKEKNVDEILDLFPKDGLYYFCSPNIFRGLDAAHVYQIALNKGLSGAFYSSVAIAYKAALAKAAPTDFIFVGGSNFVVAELL